MLGLCVLEAGMVQVADFDLAHFFQVCCNMKANSLLVCCVCIPLCVLEAVVGGRRAGALHPGVTDEQRQQRSGGGALSYPCSCLLCLVLCVHPVVLFMLVLSQMSECATCTPLVYRRLCCSRYLTTA